MSFFITLLQIYIKPMSFTKTLAIVYLYFIINIIGQIKLYT